MASQLKLADLLDREVQLYPGDTYAKFAILREITEYGMLFEITRSQSESYSPGQLVFFAYAAKLNFATVETT